MRLVYVSPWMRHLILLAVVGALGCSSPPPWKPPDRFAPWDNRPLDWLLAHQNEDGSWGEDSASVEGLTIGRIGVTAFALSAFQGYGYSQSSTDERRGTPVGPVIRRALDWLIGRQRPDGTFNGSVGDFESILAAECLMSNYMMMVDRTIRASAEAALSATMRKRKPDGSWGSPECTFMAVLVLQSARLWEDVDYDKEALEVGLRLLDEEFTLTPNRYNAIAPYIRHYRGPDKEKRKSLDWVMKELLPDPAKPEFLNMYFGSILVYGVTMIPEAHWLQWTQSMETFVEATVDRGDSWRGPSTNSTLVRTAVVALCHAAYRWNRKFEPLGVNR